MAAAPMPANLLATTMYHMGGAMPQLKSWNREGPTLYALTIVGARGASRGGASIVGPALDSRGLTDAWPLVAREAGRELFSKPLARRAGQITVVVIVQVGSTSHCSSFIIPAAEPIAVKSIVGGNPRGGRASNPRPARPCSIEAGPLA
jgi:hypothetical protein